MIVDTLQCNFKLKLLLRLGTMNLEHNSWNARIYESRSHIYMYIYIYIYPI